MCTYIYTYTHIYIHTYLYIYVIYIYIYIYIHTYIRVPKLFGQVHSRDLLTGFDGMSFFYILEVLIAAL